MKLFSQSLWQSVFPLFLVFLFFGGQCEDKAGYPFEPVHPMFTRIVTIGDSITEGVMSGDANFQTQPYTYGAFLAKVVGTEFALPLMVAESSGYHRMLPGLLVHNLGVSGMDIFLSSLTTKNKTALGWKNQTTFQGSFTDYSFSFQDELDAILSPHAAGQTVLDVAKSLSPTLIVFWLGNNDALGSVANTTSLDPGAQAYKNIVTSYPFPVVAALDDTDPRGGTFPPQNRIATNTTLYGTNFQTAYQNTLTRLLQDNPNAKVVVLNVPNITAIGHLLYFNEAIRFFSRYLKLPESTIRSVWDPNGTNRGFGGNGLGTMIPFDLALAGIQIYKQAIQGGASVSTALGQLSNTNNTGLFDWDPNYLDSSEVILLSNLIKNGSDGINDVIASVISNLPPVSKDRVVLLDIYSIFEDIRQNGATIRDIYGNTVAYLSRTYPGAGDPGATGASSNGGIFTLDGVHPGPTAHARIANEILKAIEQKWGLSLPRVDEYVIWQIDPVVDHDRDGYVEGFAFTRSSSQIGANVILRDPDDWDPNKTP